MLLREGGLLRCEVLRQRYGRGGHLTPLLGEGNGARLCLIFMLSDPSS
jgi:hypothetical protein